MATIIVSRSIEAPIEKVFDAIASVESFSQAVPNVQKIEILSEIKSGVGTRFRETRLFKGRVATEELEVTEYVLNERVRIFTDSHGCEWDSLFTVAAEGSGTLLTLNMESRPHKLIARLMNPLIKPVIRKALTSDMDAIKAWCEAAP